MATEHTGAPALVDPEDGLGLAGMEWPPPSWFESAPVPAAPAPVTEPGAAAPQWGPEPNTSGAKPAEYADLLAPDEQDDADWVPKDWYRPAAFDQVGSATGLAGESVQGEARRDRLPYQDPGELDMEPLDLRQGVGPGTAPLFPWDAPQSLRKQWAPEMVSGTAHAAAVQRSPDPGFPTAADLDEERRYAALPEEELAAVESRQKSARENLIATRVLEESERSRRRAEDNHRAFQEGTTSARRQLHAIDADLQALSKQSIDRNRWWNSRSSGQKVAAYVGAFIGGLLKVHNQGRNSTLEMISGEIDADVDAQKADVMNRRGILEQRRGLVGELYAKTGDLYRAAETARLAMLDGVEKQIMAEAARLDPRGTQAANAVAAANAVRLLKQERAMKLEQALHERAMDKARLRVQQAGVAEQRRQRELEAKKSGLIYDARGRLVADPDAPVPTLKPSDQKTMLEIQNVVEGAKVQDSRGKHIGEAKRGVEGAKVVAENVLGYENFRQNLAELNDLIASVDQDTFGPTMNRWPSETVAKIKALRQPLVFSLARVMNGTGQLSTADVQSAEASIPQIDTWTTSREPAAVAAAMATKVDREMRNRLGSEIKGWDPKTSYDPTQRYQSMDRLRAKPAEALPRETILKQVTVPISGLTMSDPNVRAAALDGRAGKLRALGDRDEGVTDDEFAQIKTALEGEVKSGDLSAAEAAGLLNTLADVREMRARWRKSFGGQRKVVQKRLERGEASPAELELFLGVK